MGERLPDSRRQIYKMRDPVIVLVGIGLKNGAAPMTTFSKIVKL